MTTRPLSSSSTPSFYFFIPFLTFIPPSSISFYYLFLLLPLLPFFSSFFFFIFSLLPQSFIINRPIHTPSTPIFYFFLTIFYPSLFYLLLPTDLLLLIPLLSFISSFLFYLLSLPVLSFTVKPRYSAFQETGKNYALYQGFHYCQFMNSCENDFWDLNLYALLAGLCKNWMCSSRVSLFY